jgi:enamine deaminase RidA (YjgF/YER057c/UK114 family)
MTPYRHEASPRMSQVVVHNSTAYLAGQIALDAPGANVADQTRAVLSQVDGLLAAVGSDKSRLLSATIWLADMASFNEMNAIWDAWIAPGCAPARATVEGKLVSPLFTIEIAVIAAAPPNLGA